MSDGAKAVSVINPKCKILEETEALEEALNEHGSNSRKTGIQPLLHKAN